MALTSEILKANAVLTGLTDEQIAAITTLSQNDENTVIGAKIGDIYRQMDTTIATATGVQRNGDEKTYNYLERATKALKDQAGIIADLNKQIGDLTKEKGRLEKVIADGGTDAETKRQLTQATADLKAVQKQYNDLKADHDKAVQTHQTELFGVRIDNELSVATAGVKFKAELPKSATDVLLQQATAKIKALNPEYIDDGKGGKIFPLRLQALQVWRVQRVALLAPVVLQGFGQALGLVGLQGFVQQAATVQRMLAQHALAPGINGEDGGIVHALGGQLQPPGGLFALGGFGVGGQ